MSLSDEAPENATAWMVSEAVARALGAVVGQRRLKAGGRSQRMNDTQLVGEILVAPDSPLRPPRMCPWPRSAVRRREGKGAGVSIIRHAPSTKFAARTQH
jgi:hypothetical protein